jgi:hypothetical protein
MRNYVSKQKYHPNFELSDERDDQIDYRKSILNGSVGIEEIYKIIIKSQKYEYDSDNAAVTLKNFVFINYKFSEDDCRYLIKRGILDIFEARVIPESIILEYIENEENIYPKNKIARRKNISSELLDKLTDISIERYKRYIKQKNEIIFYAGEDDYYAGDDDDQYTDKDYAGVIENLYNNIKLSNFSKTKIENFILDENLNEILNELIAGNRSGLSEDLKVRIYEKYKNEYDKSSSRNVLRNLFGYYIADTIHDKFIRRIIKDNIFPIMMDMISSIGNILSLEIQILLSFNPDKDIRIAFAKKVNAIDAIENLSKDPELSVRKSLVNGIFFSNPPYKHKHSNFYSILPILEEMLDREESGKIESSPELIQKIKDVIEVGSWVLGKSKSAL